MSRYKSSQQSLDDVIVENGDNHFTGFNTRLHPTLLPQGVVQRSENMRYDDFTATVRKGVDRISDDVITEGNPLVLPFSLGASINIESITRFAGTNTAVVALANAPDPIILDGEYMEVSGCEENEYNSKTLTSGSLVSGATYEIANYTASDNFLNVAATDASLLLLVVGDDLPVTAGGTGYTAGTAFCSGGTGTGVAVTYTVTPAGVVDRIQVSTVGSGYAVGDTITITGGGGNATSVLIADNFAANRDGARFVAIGTTPTTWVSSTLNEVFKFNRSSDTSYWYTVMGSPSSPATLETITSGTLYIGAEYTITTYNGSDDFTNVGAASNATSVVFTATGDTPDVWAGASVLTRSSIMVSGLIGLTTDGVFETCLFSDVDTNKEYIAMATADKVILVDPDDTATTIEIGYDTGITVEASDEPDIIQVNNGLLINRGKTEKAIEWDGNIDVTLAVDVLKIVVTSGTAVVTTIANHPYHDGDVVKISGATGGDATATNGTFTISDSSPSAANTFEYTTTGSFTAAGTIIGEKVPVFTEVADTHLTGFLSMPKAEFSTYHPFARLIVPLRVIELPIAFLSSAVTTATAVTTYDHGLQVGDRVTISGASNPEFNGVHSLTNIGAGDEVEGVDGAKADFGKFFEYTISGAVFTDDGSGSILAKIDVRDQFIVSDFYDHRTYDPVNNLFRVNRGSADELVAFLIFQEDNLIVLYKRSLHVISGMSTSSLNDSFVRQITDEVGCIARKTAVIVGRNMIFLSEQGLYMLEITTELNLRGQDIPLSFDIQDEFRDLNYDYIDKACGVYFNNRYYLAVPSSGSTRNDIVFVYNFLNKKWESKDTFTGGYNYIDNWVVAPKAGQDRLFGSSVEGALQLYEELELDEIPNAERGSFVETEIDGRLTTRRYVGGDNNSVKRFNRGTINFEVGTSDAFTVTATTENPETSVTALTEVATADEDKHKRFRINKRGTGVELDINTTVGRPQIRSVSVGSTETQMANKTFE